MLPNIKNIIRNKSELLNIVLKRGYIISYINLNNIYDETTSNFLNDQRFHFHIDSQYLARKYKVKALCGDFSGFLDSVLRSFDHIVFVGGKPEEILIFDEKIRMDYTHKNIRCISGFEENYESLIIQKGLVIISMGFPKQEYLAKKLSNHNNIVLCTGGMISQNHKNRFYPKWAISLNLRWFYRLILEKNARSRFLKVLKNFVKIQFDEISDV